jgi:hypothetical protein
LALGYLALGNLAFGEERSLWALGHLALGVLALGSLWAHNILFSLVPGSYFSEHPTLKLDNVGLNHG